MPKILFVCSANVDLSPTTELIYDISAVLVLIVPGFEEIIISDKVLISLDFTLCANQINKTFKFHIKINCEVL
jgi:hypothetical protein